jgi:hypothetical protein
MIDINLKFNSKITRCLSFANRSRKKPKKKKKKKKQSGSEMSEARPPPPLPADDNVSSSAQMPLNLSKTERKASSSEAKELRALQQGLALPSGWTSPRQIESHNNTTQHSTTASNSNSTSASDAAAATKRKEKEIKATKVVVAPADARRASTPHHHTHHVSHAATVAVAPANASEPRRNSSTDIRAASRPVDIKPPGKKAPSPLSASPEYAAPVPQQKQKASNSVAALEKAKSDKQVRKASAPPGSATVAAAAAAAAVAVAGVASSSVKMAKAASAGSVKWSVKRPRFPVRTQFAVVLADQRHPRNVRRTVAMDDGWDIVAPSENAKIAAQAAPVALSPRNDQADFIIVSVSVPSCQTVKKLKFSPWETVADAQVNIVKALRRAGGSFPLSDEAAKRFRLCTVSVLPGATWGIAGELPGIPLALDPKRTLADCGIKPMAHVAFVAFDDQAGTAPKPVKPAPAPAIVKVPSTQPTAPAPAPPAAAAAAAAAVAVAPSAPAPTPAKMSSKSSSSTNLKETAAPARPALPPLARRVSVSSDDSNSGSNISMTDDEEENDDDDDDEEEPEPPLSPHPGVPALPNGWEKLTDGNGRVYFASLVDGKSVWSRPTVAVLPPLRDGWQEHTDPATGRVFFEHSKSGKTDWIRPGLNEWKALVLNKKLQSVTWLAEAGEATHKWEFKKSTAAVKR